MSLETPHPLMQQALAAHRAGRADLAEPLYRQVLATDPANVDALHLLGVALRQLGCPSEAEPHIRAAIALNPAVGEFHHNLGNVLADLGRADEAVDAFRRAAELSPANVACAKALADELLARGDNAAATRVLEGAVERNIADAEAYNTLGVLLERQGRPHDAVAHFTSALRLQPDWPIPHNNLGNALRATRQDAAAERAYRDALQLDPRLTAALVNVASLHLDAGRYGEAITHLHRALGIDPSMPAAHAALGGALRLSGRSGEALACYRRAVELAPDDPAFDSGLLQTLNLIDGPAPADIFAAHRAWAARHARPLYPPAPPPIIDRDPHRPLRIGYVSGDFHSHAVMKCVRGILAHHDRSRVTPICFNNNDAPPGEPATDALRRLPAAWHDVHRLTDAALADLIRREQIDLLVDLSGHTARNRLLTFARRPAPLQVTYFGYQDTTGLATLDYRLTDTTADPPDQTDSLHTERLWRLDRPCWCYVPNRDDPDVNPTPPSTAAGHVTFGCLNDPSKITPRLTDAWADLLHRLPSSRLLLLAGPAGEGNEAILARLHHRGIDRSRIDLLPRTHARDYLSYYHRIDVALDTFPYTGCTTTADALHMGVPLVTLAGPRYVSRQALAILHELGLADLITPDLPQYLATARGLALDLPRRTLLRGALRPMMSTSSLLDAAALTRALEAAYHAMWQQAVRAS